jgi:hypothetical protein
MHDRTTPLPPVFATSFALASEVKEGYGWQSTAARLHDNFL